MMKLNFFLVFFVCFVTFIHSEHKAFDINSVAFDEHTYPVIIIGGGIAGLMSAHYLKQSGIDCMVIEGEKPGGSLAQSKSVRNWPGIKNLSGNDIMQPLKQQVLDHGVSITEEKVIACDCSSWPYCFEVQQINSKTKRTIKALTCLIATGVEPNYLNVPGERGDGGYWRLGVTNCAPCDGAAFRNKLVGVVGDGDSAIFEAAYLANTAKQVTIFVPKNSFRVRNEKRLAETLALAQVTVAFNTEIKKISGNGMYMTHVDIFTHDTQEIKTIPLDGLFLATGSKPNTDLFKGKIELDENGYPLLTKGQKTSCDGIYAAGDVQEQHVKQSITAAASACKAAFEIKEFLEEIGFKPKQNTSTHHQRSEEIMSENCINPATNEMSEAFLKKHINDPVVIDFYSDDCEICRFMAPIFHQLSQDIQFAHVYFMKVNVDALDADAIAEFVHGIPITNLPAFSFVHHGKEVAHINGEFAQQELSDEIQKVFKDIFVPLDRAFRFSLRTHE